MFSQLRRNGIEDGVHPLRTLPARTRGHKHMRIAVVMDGRLTDEDGHDTTDIPGYVYHAEPTIFVMVDPGWFITTLRDTYGKDHPDFQYGVRTPERDHDGVIISRTMVRAFGFYRPDPEHKHAKRKPLRGRLHQCWDVTAMSQSHWHDLTGGREREHLQAFAQDVRAWAADNNLELRDSLAGYASQLLRDSRFYPSDRRRVPRATNERAREALPGNLVTLYIEPNTGHAYDVTSIDARSAHHRIVQTTTLPDADSLYARGYFHSPDDTREYWANRSDPHYSRITAMAGLLRVGLHSRPTRPGEFRLTKQDFQGYRRVWVWTNEIEFIESTGSTIDGIYAAWTANTNDTGLAKYGAWAQHEIERATHARKRWLKPLLHSTYGLLAARPRDITIGYNIAKQGKRVSVILGRHELVVTAVTRTDVTFGPANVIQRGIIEAETQLRSLRMAQHVTDHGGTVLAIRTDGLHVVGPVPTLTDTWTTKQLTHVQYVDTQSWVAYEQSCLPGRATEYDRRKVFESALAAHHALASTRTTR